jgi:ribosomal protein L37E
VSHYPDDRDDDLQNEHCRQCGDLFYEVELDSDGRCASCVAVDLRINRHKTKGYQTKCKENA